MINAMSKDENIFDFNIYYCVVYRRVAQSAHTHPVVSEAEQALKKRQRKEEGGIDT